MEAIKIDDVINIIKNLDIKEIKRDGFILLLTDNGFDAFKIPEERLKYYLQLESLNNRINKNNEKQ